LWKYEYKYYHIYIYNILPKVGLLAETEGGGKEEKII
jgi:hypothetical protein